MFDATLMHERLNAGLLLITGGYFHKGKRGYTCLLEEPNVMLFTVTRTKDREKLFKWAGPIITSRLVFFVKRNSKIEIKSLEDAKKVDRIGLVQGYSVEKYLLQQGFTNVDNISASEKTNPSDSLQNPSDPNATYSGHKGQGYQVQVMETYL